ncbi:MAG: hypothetical protein WCF67_10240 [Chitinophagaceae bacterium]
MLLKIKRQDCLNKYPIFPLRSYDLEKDEDVSFYPKVFKSYILTLSSKSIKAHIKALGIELTGLTKAFNADVLIFLGDTETPWLHQQNEYKPVQEAQQYLVANKIGKRFNGALQADTAELPVFIKHLAWLIRCNASLPYFYFTDPGNKILVTICQYGNLHLDTLNAEADKMIKAFMHSSKLQYGNNSSCYNQFGKTGAISGRQITID